MLDLKYRPKSLDSIVGLSNVKLQLSGMVKMGNIPKRLLFYGPPGSGKTTVARLLVKYVNCDNFLCGNCDSCKEKNHPDLFEVNFADHRGIDDMRELIKLAYYVPKYKHKVLVLDEIHQATPQALQALLKPLEEPSKGTIWVLVSTDPNKLPDSIHSRCYKFEFSYPSREECFSLLKRIAKREKIGLDDKIIYKIVDSVDRQPRQALLVMESVGGIVSGGGKVDEDTITKLVFGASLDYLESIYNCDFKNSFSVVESSRTDVNSFLSGVYDTHKKVLYSRIKLYKMNSDLVNLSKRIPINVMLDMLIEIGSYLESKNYSYNTLTNITARLLKKVYDCISMEEN